MIEEKQKLFLEAYETYSDALFRFCFFKLNDRELAKDLLQETFMKVWVYISKGGEIGNIKAMLYKTAGNMIIDEYRKQGRRRGKTESLDVLNEEGFEPGFDDTASWIDKIDGAKAVALIANIPDPYGEAVFLRYVQDFSISEIVGITGESDNTICVRVHRGLVKLKELFNEETSIIHDQHPSGRSLGWRRQLKKFTAKGKRGEQHA